MKLKCHKMILLTSFAKTKPLWQQERFIQEKNLTKNRDFHVKAFKSQGKQEIIKSVNNE